LGDFGLALHVVNGKASPGTIEEGDSRYMAKELLDWTPVEDLTKCDIFSLGIAAFEISSCGCHKLEAHGHEWHLLRSGISSIILNNAFNTNNLFALQDINANHSLTNELSVILTEMLSEIPKMRPSAQLCLDSHYELKSILEKEVHILKLKLEKEVNKNISSSTKTKLKRYNTIT
jgi:serine/threonine protein kinase